MMLLVAFKLIRQCTKHAVAISPYFLDFQAKSSQLLPEFDHVNIVFGSIEFLLGSSHLTLGPTLFFFVVLSLLVGDSVFGLGLLLLLVLSAHFWFVLRLICLLIINFSG